MIVNLSVTGAGIALTLPAIIQEYVDIGEADKWYTYIKILPHFFLLLACGFRFAIKYLRVLDIPCIVSAALGWASLYYLFLFNLTASATSVCKEFEDACAEDLQGLEVCANNPVEPWQGILYLIGISSMVVGSTLLTKEMGFRLYEAKRSKIDG